jgi:CRP-like cAMP-binding protein
MSKDISNVTNGLLGTLEGPALARLAGRLKTVDLKVRQVLYKPGEHISQVFFPEDAVIVLLAVDLEGRTIESGTVGREGASWISASVSAPSMPCETIVAIEGQAYTLAVPDLDEELKCNESFQHVLTQYSHALLVASMRTTGCVGLHDVPQRCARWMLHTLDRVERERFAVTHEFLAMLMGTTRPTITLVMQMFEKSGVVRVERGAITVVDRDGLEKLSCECYRIIRDHYREVGRT